MNTDTIALLDKHFDLAINAPDGIKRLRETILTLAMQGKLVPQDPKDQSASELLKEIEAEKQRLVKEGKIKEPKPLPPIKPDEVPYEVPESWEWVRFGEIGIIGSSSRVHQKDWQSSGIPFYRAREIVKLSQNGFVENDLFISEELFSELTSNGNIPEYDDIMITGVGTIGIPYIVRKDERFYFKDASVLIFKNYFSIFSRFLMLLITSPMFVENIHKESMGTTVDTLTILRLNEQIIPLPPLAEQRRIVAKIDELMTRVGELERKRDARNEKRLAMHQAAIARLLDAGDANASRAGRDFVFAHFGELYGTKENVAELRKAILQLAVMGRLVPQDTKDQPASELLKEIEAERKRLVQEGKIKEPKPLPPIKPEELPYQVPKGWEWVCLELIGEINPRNHTDDTSDAGFVPMPLIFAEIGRSHTFEVRKWGNIKKGFTHFKNGDIGMAKITPCFENGKSCIFSDLPNGIGAGTTELHIFRNTFSVIEPRYLLHFIKNPRYLQTGETKMTGSAGQKRVPTEFFSRSPFPLPPLAEQHRIVAKVDELMALCDKLEKQIDERTAKESALLEAVAARV